MLQRFVLAVLAAVFSELQELSLFPAPDILQEDTIVEEHFDDSTHVCPFLKVRMFLMIVLCVTSTVFGKISRCSTSTHRKGRYVKENCQTDCGIFCVDCYNRDLYSKNYTTKELMVHEYARLISFNSFPYIDTFSTIKLAQSGFYYTGERSKIKCFCCGICISSLPIDKTIAEAHQQASPMCKVLQGTDLSNIPIQHPFTVDKLNLLLTSLETNLQSNNVTAKYQDYNNLEKRLSTFRKWPYSVPASRELAEAGFFFAGKPDSVCCFECGQGIKEWTEDDDPWIEHARFSPTCQHVRSCKGDRFVKLVLDTFQCSERGPIAQVGRPDLAEQLCIVAGYSSVLVKQAIDFIRTNSVSYTVNHTPNAPNVGDDTASSRTDLERRISHLSEENRRLHTQIEEQERQTVCKVCLIEEAIIVFLPCDHLACCENCAVQLHICAVCRTSITEKIKVYKS